jgi:hypothetical protein
MSKVWASRIGILSLFVVVFATATACAKLRQYNVIVVSIDTTYTVDIDYTRYGKPRTAKLVGPGSKTFAVVADSIDKVSYEKTGTNTNGLMILKIEQGKGNDRVMIYDSGKITNSVKVELTQKDMKAGNSPTP